MYFLVFLEFFCINNESTASIGLIRIVLLLILYDVRSPNFDFEPTLFDF